MKSRDGELQIASCWVSIAMLLGFGLASSPLRVGAQTFSSGSDGSDLEFAPSGPPGTVVVFDPSRFSGTQVSANIFNFTTITIPAGVTVRLSGNKINGPVYWLAQGDVDIEGTVDLSGGNGYDVTANPFLRVPSVPGSGGYGGGVGGDYPSAVQQALPGNGPGGGTAGTRSAVGGQGAFSGNQFLIPLVGGSGGGGSLDTGLGEGGGAGGGALLIASSTQIIANGTISANGGSGGVYADRVTVGAGGGSGGAVRLVANTIAGTGVLSAKGGTGYGGAVGGRGIVRLEAATLSFVGSVQGTLAEATPFPLLLPTAGSPSAKVISINGVAINPNPAAFPDIMVNTTSAIPVVIQAHNIPTTATINLTILNQNGVPDTVIPAPPLGNCDPDNFCTTTVDVVFPFGASRGLTRVTWTQ